MNPNYRHSATVPLLIIGGGIHGTIYSLAMATRFPREYHLVIDPHTAPLSRWERNCLACGLQYLRSPVTHQLSAHPHSLLHFQRKHASTTRNDILPFIPLYKRPLFSLFMQHANNLVKQHRLMQFRIRASCQRILLQEKRAIVETDHGSFTAERVLICTGLTEQLRIPHWIPTRNPVWHVFSDRFNINDYCSQKRVVIVGGGITALQLALTMADMPLSNISVANQQMASTITEQKASQQSTKEGSRRREVIVVAKHKLRYADFDSDPCYLGPRCLSSFDSLGAPQEKEKCIATARNRASIPPDIAKQFNTACADGRCQLIIGEISHTEQNHSPNDMVTNDLHSQSSNGYRLQLTDGKWLNCDAIILATGFEDNPLHSPLLSDLQQRYGLPCSESGRPLTDRQLRWHPRLLLSGSAASLTIGPAAGNIIGAHLALRRILPLLLDRPYRNEYAWKPIGQLDKK